MRSKAACSFPSVGGTNKVCDTLVYISTGRVSKRRFLPISTSRISVQELTILVRLPDSISTRQDRLEKLTKICGSFLTLREQVFYFVHQSAKDFLLGKATHQASGDAFNWVFPLGVEDVNHTIFSKSLNMMSTVLRRDMYGLEAPGFPIDEVQTPASDPLATVRYPCIFWVDHLRDSISNNNTAQRKTVGLSLALFYLAIMAGYGVHSMLPTYPAFSSHRIRHQRIRFRASRSCRLASLLDVFESK